MSTTTSTQAMVARLQRKTGLGLGTADCMNFLNEAFRKVNQMSKGGFIWQFKKASPDITTPASDSNIVLPADFDPGKTAVLRGPTVAPLTATSTLIPYVPMKDFANEQDYQTTAVGAYSAWTFFPSFTVSGATNYPYVMRLAPATAFDGAQTFTLSFWYHAVNFPAFTEAANVFFPTPDQFDSLILDLAVAEVRNVYGMARIADEYQLAFQAIAEAVDTYRTDRYDLAGLTDQVAQAQEKQTENAK